MFSHPDAAHGPADHQKVAEAAPLPARPRLHDSLASMVFFACIAIATTLLTWSVRSTVIDSVDTGVLSMVQALPPTYWAGFALLLIATTIWFMSRETKKVHFVLPFLWTAYLFIGPELMEAHHGTVTAYSHAQGVSYVRSGLQEEFYYFPYLGLHYLTVAFSELLDVSYLNTPRIATALIYLGFCGALLVFFPGKALLSARSKLLGALIGLALFQITTALDYHPQSLGVIFILLCLYVLSSGQGFSVSNRATLILLYLALTITHGLSTLFVVYIVVLLTLAALWRRWLNKSQEERAVPSPVFFGVVFIAWLALSSDLVFARVVSSFRDNVLREPFALVAAGSHVSPARGEHGAVALLTFAFLAVLGVWLLTIAWQQRLWINPRWESIFPLLVVSGLPIVVIGTGNFTYESFVRGYLLAVPFLALFLARGAISSRGTVVFLPALLILGFVLLYGRESVELPPSTEFAGANFVARTVQPESTILQGSCLTVGQLTNTLPDPTSSCLASPEYVTAMPVVNPSDFTFTIVSDWDDNYLRWAYGNDAIAEQLRAVRQEENMFAKIYSNGDYEVFTPSVAP